MVVLTIANDETGSPDGKVGHYNCELLIVPPDKPKRLIWKGRVENFDRRLGAEVLVKAAAVLIPAQPGEGARLLFQ